MEALRSNVAIRCRWIIWAALAARSYRRLEWDARGFVLHTLVQRRTLGLELAFSCESKMADIR